MAKQPVERQCISATEGMSSPYRVELTLASLTEDEDEVSFDAVIGKEALLTMASEGSDRYFHGIISQWAGSMFTGRFWSRPCGSFPWNRTVVFSRTKVFPTSSRRF